jgi:hypothetical protein
MKGGVVLKRLAPIEYINRIIKKNQVSQSQLKIGGK